MLFNTNINNLSGGVSQQVDIARYNNQVEEMVNFVPTVAKGLRRRNPVELVSALSTNSNMSIHSYSRGDNIERYGMIMSDSGLQVFDVDGTPKTVIDFGTSGNTVLEKWAGTDWNKHIKFLTVGDTTWILNTSVTVATTGAVTPSDTNPYSAFFWIKRSFNDGIGGVDHGYSYSITINGTSISYNHSDSTAVATYIANSLNGASFPNISATNKGSIIYITSTADFTMSTGDSYGNQASSAWKDNVAKIQDLPADMNGFTEAEVGTIAVTGTDKDNFTNYYLRWKGDHWQETVKEGIKYKIDAMTMPAKLVRQSNGTFVLGWNVVNATYEGFNDEWEERKKGDDDSNPMPSFIGEKISNMFFFKNRLGLTSGENVILSQTGKYYNFFASTVIEVLDSDTIDAAADSNNISIIKAVNVTAGAVTLWTDTAQFILSGGEILSPATTRISQTSSYVANPEVHPVNVDNEILFFHRNGSYLNVSIYAPSSVDNDKSTAATITAHIPEYLPSGIDQIELCASQNLLCLFNPNEPNKIYAYKYHIEDNTRIMSAWFEWHFNLTIKKINILEEKLYIIADALYSIDLEAKPITDTFLDKGTDTYSSYVKLSRFHVQTNQGTQHFREKFYVKTVLPRVDGDVDLVIINEERNNAKTIATKHVALGRKIIVGGHSDKVKLKFSTSYANGVAINALSLEGQAKYRSTNKD